MTDAAIEVVAVPGVRLSTSMSGFTTAPACSIRQF